MEGILKLTVKIKKEMESKLRDLADRAMVHCEVLKVNNTYFRVSEPDEEGCYLFDKLDDFKVLDTYSLLDILESFNQSTEVEELTLAEYVKEIKGKYGDTAWDLFDGFLGCVYGYETRYEMLSKIEKMLEFYDENFCPLSNEELQKKISF